MKNKTLKILIAVVCIGVVGNISGCNKIEKNDNEVDIKTEEEINNNKEEGKVEEGKNQSSIVQKVENEEIDFSKYTDEDIVNLANKARDKIDEMKGFTIKGIPIDKEDHFIVELDEYDLEERTDILLDYYADVNLVDEYVEIDGKTYLKKYFWKDEVSYLFKGVKSKEVIDNKTLRVVFDVKIYHGFPVVNKNTKTVDFTEVDGKLKAKTLLIDESIYGVIENRDESRPIEEVNNEAKELWYYLYEKLNDGVLKENQKLLGTGERDYDERTDSIYYGISIKEPNQSGESYYVNIKNGDIYGHYEKKFVVRAGKVVK